MATRILSQGRIWNEEEVQSDCRIARDEFRQRRVNESLEEYLREFDNTMNHVKFIVEHLNTIIAATPNQELLARIVANQECFTALRYITAPPISKDDLDTILDSSVTQTRLRNDAEFAASLVALLRDWIDPRRFPWLKEERTPNPEEYDSAILATTIALTAQRVHTIRRGDEKNELEQSVVNMLENLGFTRLPTPRENVFSTEDLPQPGQYMLEVTLGADNADCVIGLYDRRRLAIECKGSNSTINSRKRLNKEVVKDAKNWANVFGKQVVAAAALRGVYNPRYVLDAQETPLLIFWGHRLEDLRDFIISTKQ